MDGTETPPDVAIENNENLDIEPEPAWIEPDVNNQEPLVETADEVEIQEAPALPAPEPVATPAPELIKIFTFL